MIFATVGTHEDPFDRLVVELDRLVETGTIQEEVRMQCYATSCSPKNFEIQQLLPFDIVEQNMAEARVVITAAGPATIMQVISHGKIPIVVPRNGDLGEHVDNHQVRFARRLAARLLVVENIEDLGRIITNYEKLSKELVDEDAGPNAADAFAIRLGELCGDLVGGRPGTRS